MSKLAIIDERELLGKEFRIYGTFENPLFLAKDVANWIEHSDVSTMLRKVDEDEKVTNNVCTLGGSQKAWFLTENGLYEVLMQSRKPIAKEFKKKVKEILKSIRKNGAYMTNEVIEKTLTDPDFLIQLATQLKEERQARIKAEKENKVLIEENNKLEIEVERKEDVIIGLVKDISIAEKRQRITQIIRHGTKKYAERYSYLYDEFDRKFHVDTKRRLDNAIEKGEIKKSVNRMTYICEIMNMTNELYEIACKIFENDVEQLKREMWETIAS